MNIILKSSKFKQKISYTKHLVPGANSFDFSFKFYNQETITLKTDDATYIITDDEIHLRIKKIPLSIGDIEEISL